MNIVWPELGLLVRRPPPAGPISQLFFLFRFETLAWTVYIYDKGGGDTRKTWPATGGSRSS